MFDFDITKLVPKFLREDRNGYAMMKALEAGMNYFLEVAQVGLDTWGTPERMPEWRLDELAWEYDIVYDSNAAIAEKREWIKNAVDFYRIYGTVEGIRQYLLARFTDVEVKEWWEYDGEPYHFKVTVSGEWSQSISAWTVNAINEIKNARSVLDELDVNGDDSIAAVLTGTQISGTEIYMTANTSS